MTDTTVDKLLGGRFEVEQPAKGYRIAVDTLLLASAVPAKTGQSVCELGCGVGGVMLALATRLKDISITGLEFQVPMAALCESNIRRNDFQDRLRVVAGDVVTLPQEFIGAFDHVMMNPPYHDHKSHTVSAIIAKRLAHAESDDADLGVWLAQSAQCLKQDGMMSLIHRGDRLDEIIENTQKHFGRVLVKPIVSKQNAPAKRVIVRGIKEKGGDVTILPPFMLYGPDGRYSQAGEDVLRECQAMPFD